MVTLAAKVISLLLSLIMVGIAVRKWNIIRDRRHVLSVIKNALKEKKALISGVFMALFYLAVFMIPGGRGGRIHVLFGQVIWNTTATEMLTGILLAILVMIAMSLFVFGVGVIGAKQSGKKSGMGFLGSLLALLAAFCP